MRADRSPLDGENLLSIAASIKATGLEQSAAASDINPAAGSQSSSGSGGSGGSHSPRWNRWGVVAVLLLAVLVPLALHALRTARVVIEPQIPPTGHLSAIGFGKNPGQLTYQGEKGVDLFRLLQERQKVVIDKGLLKTQLEALFRQFEIPAVYDERDLTKARNAGVAGHLTAGTALDDLLANAKCNKEVINNEIVLVYCNKRYEVVRKAYLPPKLAAQMHPEIIQRTDGFHCYRLLKDACVHPEQGLLHIPKGDASQTVEAFFKLYKFMGKWEKPAVLSTDDFKGKETQAVDIRFNGRAELERMLHGSGLVIVDRGVGISIEAEN